MRNYFSLVLLAALLVVWSGSLALAADSTVAANWESLVSSTIAGLSESAPNPSEFRQQINGEQRIAQAHPHVTDFIGEFARIGADPHYHYRPGHGGWISTWGRGEARQMHIENQGAPKLHFGDIVLTHRQALKEASVITALTLDTATGQASSMRNYVFRMGDDLPPMLEKLIAGGDSSVWEPLKKATRGTELHFIQQEFAGKLPTWTVRTIKMPKGRGESEQLISQGPTVSVRNASNWWVLHKKRGDGLWRTRHRLVKHKEQ